MGADVGERFALLQHIEEPGRAQVGHAGHQLQDVVHALHIDGGLRLGAGQDGAEDRRIVDQLALQHGGDLEALGHDVVGHEAVRGGDGERAFELGRSALRMIHGLSARTCMPAFERGADEADLGAVAAGEDDDVAGAVVDHALQVVGRGMNVELPGGGASLRRLNRATRFRCSMRSGPRGA